MSIFKCSPCSPSDPATDTVKVSVPDAGFGVDAEMAAEAEARRVAEEVEEAARREEEEARCRAEEEAKQLAAEKRRLAEEQARAKEEEEKRRQQQLEAEREERAKAEAEHLEAEQKRKETVGKFLTQYKFKGVATPKRSIFSTTYPIHRAAEIGNPELVQLLIQEGADPLQKNSGGKTAVQVAQKKDKKGSHYLVVQALGGA
jgi:hypothetical protein